MDVLLFGIIAEKAGAASISVEVDSTQGLRKALIDRIPGIDRLSYAIAVDRMVVIKDRPLRGGEEVAVLPPFAGG